MNFKAILSLLVTCTLFASNVFSQNTWTQLPDFPGMGRDVAFDFSLDNDNDGTNDRGYVGAGWNSNGTSYTDVWEYNPAANTWAQKADYPGIGTRSTTSFALNNIGYVVGGAYGNNLVSNEVWAYNAITNTWTQKNDFPIGVWGGETFVLNNKAYYVLGNSSGSVTAPILNTIVYEYNEANDSWTAKNNIPFTGKFLGIKVELDTDNDGITDRAFVGCGMPRNGNSVSDFWEYLPATDTWERKADVPGPKRGIASCFSIGAKGYVGLGWGEAASSDFYEYDPIQNTWLRITDHPGTATMASSTFVIGNEGFVACGKPANFSVGLQQFYKYAPQAGRSSEVHNTTYADINTHHPVNAPELNPQLIFFPNPANHSINIITPFPASGQAELKIVDMIGRIIISERYLSIADSSEVVAMDVSTLPAGTYLVVLTLDGKFITGKLVKE